MSSGAHRVIPSIQPPFSQSPLAGLRVLIVEDEALVAMDCAAVLESAGAAIAGTAGNVRDALSATDRMDIDAVLLDGNLHGQPVDEVAAALARRRIPFLFVTGYGSESLPRAFAHAPILNKPYKPEDLVATVARLRAADRHNCGWVEEGIGEIGSRDQRLIGSLIIADGNKRHRPRHTCPKVHIGDEQRGCTLTDVLPPPPGRAIQKRSPDLSGGRRTGRCR